MRKLILAVLLLVVVAIIVSCAGIKGAPQDSSNGSSGGSSTSGQFSGVLMWKGDTSGKGLYSNETKLTPANVNPSQFGKITAHTVEGMILAQPLYLSHLDMGAKGIHDVMIVVTEHNSVCAYDVADPSEEPLWERDYAETGATPAPDNFGGRTTIGGEIGITGTPVIDPATGAMYFVTMQQVNGVSEQWLRAINVKTGEDFGPGSVKIQASVPGDGKG